MRRITNPCGIVGIPSLERVLRLRLAGSWEGRDEKEFLRCSAGIFMNLSVDEGG